MDGLLLGSMDKQKTERYGTGFQTVSVTKNLLKMIHISECYDHQNFDTVLEGKTKACSTKIIHGFSKEKFRE